MQRLSYHAPELLKLGHLRSFVQTGAVKSAGPREGGGGGGGEEAMQVMFTNTDFSRSSSSSDSSSGRSGRGN